MAAVWTRPPSPDSVSKARSLVRGFVMLLQLLAQGVRSTHCTTVDVATHVLQSKHGRGIRDAR